MKYPHETKLTTHTKHDNKNVTHWTRVEMLRSLQIQMPLQLWYGPLYTISYIMWYVTIYVSVHIQYIVLYVVLHIL